jgi:aminoglycoside 6'-N-acetyltransferase I
MNTGDIAIRLLGPGDAAVLAHVAPEVFDEPVHPDWSAQFLADPRHHLVVAIHHGQVVGMATGLHYVHPDKPPELWVNEVGVAPTHRRRGIGRALLAALFERGRALGCGEAWLGTDAANSAARALYRAAGGREAPMVYVAFAL